MQPSVSPALLNTTFVDALDFVSGRYCVGQVEDNGHGISEEHQKQLFKRFHRGWAKESSIPGTGLGLALVKEQLTLYNGDIHFDSTLGLGTTFTFWIPFERNTTQADDTRQQAKT
jgi:signal transduction histidine kinase